MPLSPPAARERLHTRTITCHGYQRADGLFDIEGHITDVKTTPVPNEWRRDIPPGVPIHEMWARLTLDKDMLVVSAEAASDHTPYEICPAVAPSFAALAGLRIGPGWRKLVKETVGGTKGCTHIVELIGVLGTVAYQTLWPVRAKEYKSSPTTRPPILDTCHALRSDGPVVKRFFPTHYVGDGKPR
ncbi:MAG: DUF2889 domain-containing protein [Alphaproteobacteria bacterium]|nr:DUF2889 domain-containing protein [Alphaproteobacteria bacterium]